MSTDLTRLPAQIENVMINGDLSKLSPQDRTNYYMVVCESIGLNPLTKPFEYMTLNGKMVLYANRNCAEQLRSNKGVSITDMTQQVIGADMLIVTVKGVDNSGRCDIASGAVSLGTLKGEALANAYLKCETKAKRRLTLSICGLGMLDETEVDSIPTARKIEHAPPAAEPVTPVMARPRLGSIFKTAIEQISATGRSITIAEFTVLACEMMTRYYDTLKDVEDGDWKQKGAAMGNIYEHVDEEEAEMIRDSILNLILPSEGESELEVAR